VEKVERERERETKSVASGEGRERETKSVARGEVE
jgi:hypothetical protein